MPRGIKRKSLKELREPDEFQSLSQRFLDYAKQNERQVTIAIAALAALIVVALGIRWYRAAALGHAEEAFAKAYAAFSATSWEEAATAFDGVAKGWPHTRPGRLALVFQANALNEAGKTAEAQSAYQALLDAAGPDELLRQIALYNLGQLKKGTGDATGAATDLGRAAETEGPLRAAAWLARLSTQQSFSENAGAGMTAINELPPETRAYVESRMGTTTAPPPAAE
jgi:predicted negative regulator of RcsB-dependent stress response